GDRHPLPRGGSSLVDLSRNGVAGSRELRAQSPDVAAGYPGAALLRDGRADTVAAVRRRGGVREPAGSNLRGYWLRRTTWSLTAAKAAFRSSGLPAKKYWPSSWSKF